MIEANFNVAFTNDEVNRKWLGQLLSDGVVAVKFTKKDGTDRTLMCTLSQKVIPDEYAPKGEDTRKKSSDALAVFDVENEGWRSFRWDSVKSVSMEA
jgi:hypothetical protein